MEIDYYYPGQRHTGLLSHLIGCTVYFIVLVVVRKILSYFKLTINIKMIMYFCALVYAYCGEYINSAHWTLPHLSPSLIFTIYLPILILKGTYNLDVHLLKKFLPETLYLTIFGTLLFATVYSFSCMFFLNFQPRYDEVIIYGFALAGFDTIEKSRFYYHHDNLRYAVVILEGECMLGIAASCIYVELCHALISECLTAWYFIFWVILRFIGGGLLCGWILSKVCSWLVLSYFTDFYSTIVGILVYVYLAFFMCEYILCVSGPLVVFIISLNISNEGSRLSTKSNQNLLLCWGSSYRTIEYFTYFTIISQALKYTIKYSEGVRLFEHISIYFIGAFVRIIKLFVLAWLLYVSKRPQISKNMLVMYWFTKKGVVQLILTLIVAQNAKTNISAIFVGHALAYVFVNIIIHAIFTKLFLRAFGVTNIVTTRKLNLVNCKKIIEQKKDHFIKMLKMNRTLADSKWSMLQLSTLLEAPECGDGHDGSIQPRRSYCIDCDKEIAVNPTPAEYQQMIKNAYLRVLKGQRVSFVRQYEKGFLSKVDIRYIMHKLETSLETSEFVPIGDIVTMFRKTNCIDVLRDFCLQLSKLDPRLKPPRKYSRRIFYHVVYRTVWYNLFMFVFIIFSILNFYPIWKNHYIFEIVITAVFSLDFCAKIVAYSHVYYREGFRIYFRNNWTKFEFLALMFNFTSTIYHTTPMYGNSKWIDLFDLFIISVTHLRILLCVVIIYSVKEHFTEVFNSIILRRLGFAYNIGQSMLMCYNEIHHMLPLMVEQKAICDSIYRQLFEDCEVLMKEICWIQKVMPSVPATVKTENITRTTLYNMKESIKRLKLSGLADDFEFMSYNETIEIQLNAVLDVKIKSSCDPETIFREQPWLENVKEVDYLFDNAITSSWNTGEHVIKYGYPAGGIIVIIEGLLLESYIPDKMVLHGTKKYGKLPVQDYIHSTDFTKSHKKCIMPGNSIGQLSVLTGRPYSCILIALARTKALFIPKYILEEALSRTIDSSKGLYNNLWKFICINMASSIIWEAPLYRSLSDEELYFHMKKSFVPNLTEESVFVSTDAIEDIILIEGVVQDVNSLKLYVAPCHIPRSIHKLQLKNLRHKAPQPKLLIIPMKDNKRFVMRSSDTFNCENQTEDEYGESARAVIIDKKVAPRHKWRDL